jgi:hypothetical protein
MCIRSIRVHFRVPARNCRLATCRLATAPYQCLRISTDSGFHLAGDEVIMSIARHVSRAMLLRYSHVRMESKRRALDEIAARQRAADERRKAEGEQRRQAASTSQSAAVQ